MCVCRKNAPGALCVVDGQEVTRERKLLAWAGDMAVQRSELRRTRMELAQAREEIRVLRAELSVLRMEVRVSFPTPVTAARRQVFRCCLRVVGSRRAAVGHVYEVHTLSGVQLSW